jgi:hypothetical protein
MTRSDKWAYKGWSRGRGSMGGRGSRGACRKLHWQSLRELVQETIADWEGPPFFTLDGFIDHIHDDYWARGRSHGHYRGSGIYDIRRRLRSPVGVLLRGWNFERQTYGRLQPRRDRFGFLITRGISFWSFPDCELPPSDIRRITSLQNLGKLEGEEE